MKFETAGIHFLVDDLAAVAVVVNVLKREMHLLPILLKANTERTFLKLFKALTARVLTLLKTIAEQMEGSMHRFLLGL